MKLTNLHRGGIHLAATLFGVGVGAWAIQTLWTHPFASAISNALGGVAILFVVAATLVNCILFWLFTFRYRHDLPTDGAKVIKRITEEDRYFLIVRTQDGVWVTNGR